MENYTHRSPPRPQQQQKAWTDCRRRKPFVEDDRQINITAKKMRLLKDTEHLIKNDGSNPNFSQWHRSGRTSRSPPPGFDPLSISSNGNKTPQPCLPPSGAKAVNWRLACFLAKEYLHRGTLLGKPWPPQNSNTRPPVNGHAQAKRNLEGDEAAREGKALYSTLTTDFLLSDDIHIPGIFNPLQVAAWFGFK